MSALTIIAHINAKADKVELVKAELQKLIQPTLAEQGCINYDLHQDNDNPAHFMFFENWQSRELWRKHMDSKHLADYLVAVEGAIESFTVNEMNAVSA